MTYKTKKELKLEFFQTNYELLEENLIVYTVTNNPSSICALFPSGTEKIKVVKSGNKFYCDSVRTKLEPSTLIQLIPTMLQNNILVDFSSLDLSQELQSQIIDYFILNEIPLISMLPGLNDLNKSNDLNYLNSFTSAMMTKFLEMNIAQSTRIKTKNNMYLHCVKSIVLFYKYQRIHFVIDVLNFTNCVECPPELAEDVEVLKRTTSFMRSLDIDLKLNFETHKEVLLINPSNVFCFEDNPSVELLSWIIDNKKEIFYADSFLIKAFMDRDMLDKLLEKSFFDFDTLEDNDILMDKLEKSIINFSQLSHSRKIYYSNKMNELIIFLSCNDMLSCNKNISDIVTDLMENDDVVFDCYISIPKYINTNLVLLGINSEKRAKNVCRSFFKMLKTNKNLTGLCDDLILLKLAQYVSPEYIEDTTMYFTKERIYALKPSTAKSARK